MPDKHHSQQEEKKFFGVRYEYLKNPVVTLIIGLAIASGFWKALVPGLATAEASSAPAGSYAQELSRLHEDLARMEGNVKTLTDGQVQMRTSIETLSGRIDHLTDNRTASTWRPGR